MRLESERDVIMKCVHLFPSSKSRVSAALPKFPDRSGPENGNCLEALLVKKSLISGQMVTVHLFPYLKDEFGKKKKKKKDIAKTGIVLTIRKRRRSTILFLYKFDGHGE